MEGWICLYRKILDNPIICKDSDYFTVFSYLLLNATHEERYVIFDGKKIKLGKGELITGRKVIAVKFNISESKIQRILKVFENEHQIEQQKSTKNRLISIVKWEQYQNIEQQNEQQVNNKRTTNEQQVNTNNNETMKQEDNKYNNVCNEESKKLAENTFAKIKSMKERLKENLNRG